MTDKDKVKNCYRQMYDGMVSKDRKILAGVLDETFVLIHMSEMRQDKEAFIQAVENGTLNYYFARHQSVDADINGRKANLTGRSMVNAAVFGGGRHTWRLQLTLKLIKVDEEWKITEAKASTY